MSRYNEDGSCSYSYEQPTNCHCTWTRCPICKEEFNEGEMYEYRGALACEADFNAAIEKRDRERDETIAHQEAEIAVFKGLDFGDGPIGTANRKILGGRLKQYKRATKDRTD